MTRLLKREGNRQEPTPISIFFNNLNLYLSLIDNKLSFYIQLRVNIRWSWSF